MKTRLQLWSEKKKEYPDFLVLFRINDFYETFQEDAQTLSSICECPITTRIDQGEETMMARFPHSQLEKYLRKLLCKKKKVSICEE